MAPQGSHAKTHSLLLLQKLFNLKDGASPLTLIVDSLEQPAWPVVREFVSRAETTNTKTIFVSFSTLRKPKGFGTFVSAFGCRLSEVKSELVSNYASEQVTGGAPSQSAQKILIVIDSLNALSSQTPQPHTFLLDILTSPQISLLLIHHADVPLPAPHQNPSSRYNEYAPSPLTLLTHLSTAIIRLSPLSYEIARHLAAARSLAPPQFGFASEEKEGVILSLRPVVANARVEAADAKRGVVLDVELRRRSGRSNCDRFVLVPFATGEGGSTAKGRTGRICLLNEYGVFRPQEEEGDGDGEEAPQSTFDLGLTEKQRKDREGVVLPYFDAQTEIGGGLGGRILYDMGREDDFDDEEDEI